MNLEQALADHPVVLTGGSVIERLRRDPSIELDPDVLNAAFVMASERRDHLAACYREYLDIGAAHDLPMICSTPTWRANHELSTRAGYVCEQLNGEAAQFMAGIRAAYGPYSDKILIAGLMGCRGDAYDPHDALGPDQATAFHQVQAEALAAAGVDFLLAVTLPAAPEAIGMAAALSACGLPYMLSFVIRPSGRLLDGTTLQDAVAVIDTAATPPPVGYWANCVHPTVFASALDRALTDAPWLTDRVIGLQANTSALAPEELDSCPVLHTEDPEPFVAAMMQVHHRFGTRILGGCCGTAPAHIEEMARQVSALQR